MKIVKKEMRMKQHTHTISLEEFSISEEYSSLSYHYLKILILLLTGRSFFLSTYFYILAFREFNSKFFVNKKERFDFKAKYESG